jgi:hypothetical protein
MFLFVKLTLVVIYDTSNPIISPRKSSFVGTLNTRTLKAQWKLYELVIYCQHNQINLLAIQEHRRYFQTNADDDPIRRLHVGHEWWFVYTSATESGFGGVGFLMCNRFYSNISKVTSVSPRTLRIKFGSTGNFICEAFSIYSPTATACNRELVEEFYNLLGTNIQDISLRIMLII